MVFQSVGNVGCAVRWVSGLVTYAQSRCLSLWNNDRSLSNALALAKSVLVLIDILNVLWPCSRQQRISFCAYTDADINL